MEATEPDAGRTPFAEFYGGEMVMLVRFVMRHGADVHEAADAAQTAFVRAFIQWDEIHNPRSWLRKVAYREFLRRIRVTDELVEETPQVPGPLPPDAQLELDEETLTVTAAFARLPYTQRRVMSYHYDGFANAEIAAELSMSPEAVRQNVHRARKTLAGLLLEEAGERQ